MNENCEILAPVGSMEMLVSAVRSGADAVYFGAKEFSARRNAENFGVFELKNAIEYCHTRGVKAYLTLNILIKERELKSAFDLAKNAYNLGIDGIIIEDLGLAKILREKIPNLKLHASTQMSVHSVSALPILKEMGFVRVVAAREMSKKDLNSLCKRAEELGMEIEVFVHGALCMCLSGQCQLSAFLGQRSGNRGLCAGPCRLPFKAEKGTGYDLSLKDLSLLDHLNELREMGVKSFKIEGRMKRPEYVACAVASAKQSLEKGYIDPSLAETLKNVFSRQGFTDGYYTDNLGRDMFGIRTKEDVVSADKAFPLLHQLYRGERQSVPVSVKAEIRENTPMELKLSDGENTVTVLGDTPQKAKTKALEQDDVLNSLTKFGGTPYYAEGGGVDLQKGLFVSKGSLNELRRRAIEELDIKRAETKIEPCYAEYSAKNFAPQTRNQSLICRFEDKTQIPDDLSGISAIVYPLEKDPDLSVSVEKIADIPRGIISEELIQKRLRLFKEHGFNTCLCGNLASVEIARKEGFNIIADTGLNIFNSESAAKAEEWGVRAVTMSYELSIEEGKFGSNLPLGIIAYGKVPLMTFKNCPIKNGKTCNECDKRGMLTDRKGIDFPVRCRMGYSEMLNSVPIWLADRKTELNHLDFLTLYFTDESRERVAEVINAYKNGLSTDIKYTRGLYYKGTI